MSDIVYPGADGIKTGYIDASGYNLVTTALRDNTRLMHR
jgi:D-alanyl-D-alanine carboxypeptidase